MLRRKRDDRPSCRVSDPPLTFGLSRPVKPARFPACAYGVALNGLAACSEASLRRAL